MDAFLSGTVTLVAFLVMLGLLVLVHELGHFLTAIWLGIKVEEFGMGIRPKLFGWVRNGVIYSVNAIPFGGFVRVKGEDGDNMESDSMNAKSPGQRAFFLSAGSLMNLLFAVLLMIVVDPFELIARPQSDPAT